MVSKAHIKATTKYESKAYDKVLLRIRKDGDLTRDDITAAATAAGQSVNEYIMESIRQRMTRAAASGSDRSDQGETGNRSGERKEAKERVNNN